jgi:hypothetical protein
MKKIEQS